MNSCEHALEAKRGLARGGLKARPLFNDEHQFWGGNSKPVRSIKRPAANVLVSVTFLSWASRNMACRLYRRFKIAS